MTFNNKLAKGGGAALALSLGLMGAAWADPALQLSAPSQVGSGASFVVSVNASGLTDLFAFEFDVKFDPAVFQLTSVSEGSFLSSGGTVSFDGGQVDNATGSVSYVFGSLIGNIPGVTGNGVLATLTFSTVGGNGTTGAFSLANTIALNSALADINVTTGAANVAVVPEPSSYLLMLAGLAAIGRLASRRKQAAAA